MNSFEKLAQQYDEMGRVFYKTAQLDMADAGTEYGAGSKIKNSFLGLVKRISGRLKSRKGKIRPGYAKRRRK